MGEVEVGRSEEGVSEGRFVASNLAANVNVDSIEQSFADI